MRWFVNGRNLDLEIATDEDEDRKIAAKEALKKLDEVKNFIEVNGSDHLNLIFNELIENMSKWRSKNKKMTLEIH